MKTPIDAIAHLGFVLVSSSIVGLVVMLVAGWILSKKTKLKPQDRAFATKAIGTFTAVAFLIARI